MQGIKSITYRRVLNSHVEFTTEFVVRLQDDSVGIAASPQGETISIYEDGSVLAGPQSIIRQVEADGLIGRELNQEMWDDYLQQQIGKFGRNNAYSLSLAFAHAQAGNACALEISPGSRAESCAPLLCCNILNGGAHAYTNPVLSDFPEYLLVAKSNDLETTIQKHNEIQKLVRQKLIGQPKTVVCGNPVSRFDTADNRECIDFLRSICEEIGVSRDFELMIDASAGDLWKDEKYRLTIAESREFSPEAFRGYWLELIERCEIKFLEDPFHEKDWDTWQSLTAAQGVCKIIGDNLYSSDAGRLAEGAARKLTHGVVIKPNQAGTVTGIRRAIDIAQKNQQLMIASHRSISTEETLISTLSCVHNIGYIKIGPLATDYSSVVRLNQIIRLSA